jgi:hypothetical protein
MQPNQPLFLSESINMYTSLNGMTPLTNAPKLSYDVAGLGDLFAGMRNSHKSSPGPTRGFTPNIIRHKGGMRKARPLTGLGEFDFSSIIGSAIDAASKVGSSLIQGHYAPNAAQPMQSAPASIIPSSQSIQYLPVQSSGSGSGKYLMIGGGVAVAALLGFMLMRRRK